MESGRVEDQVRCMEWTGGARHLAEVEPVELAMVGPDPMNGLNHRGAAEPCR